MFKIVGAFCQLCRHYEVEHFGTVLEPEDPRHLKACEEAECSHPPFYAFDRDELEEAQKELNRRIEIQKRMDRAKAETDDSKDEEKEPPKDPLDRYVEDLSDRNPEKVSLTIKRDSDVVVNWTDVTWNDGVPVTKWFSRNPTKVLHLVTGEQIEGVVYQGYHTGRVVFDFLYRGGWYSIQGNNAKFFLYKQGRII